MKTSCFQNVSKPLNRSNSFSAALNCTDSLLRDFLMYKKTTFKCFKNTDLIKN